MNTSIHHSETICNSLKKLSITQKLSNIAIKHIITIIITIFSFGYRGKTVNLERNSDNHRTTVALKTNRIIFPAGVGISISKPAENIREEDRFFHPVTVKGRKYLVCRIECKLKDIDNAVILITYPAGAFHNPKALRAFLCTNAELSTEDILSMYTERWDIEVFFRDSKSKLALDKYQIRSAKGIKRFWFISSLACLIARSESENFDFSEGYHILTKKIETEQLENLFLAAKNCDDFEAFKDLAA